MIEHARRTPICCRHAAFEVFSHHVFAPRIRILKLSLAEHVHIAGSIQAFRHMLIPCRRLPVRIHDHIHWDFRHHGTFLFMQSELILVSIIVPTFLLIWTAASLLALCQQAKIATFILKYLVFISILAHVIIEIGL